VISSAASVRFSTPGFKAPIYRSSNSCIPNNLSSLQFNSHHPHCGGGQFAVEAPYIIPAAKQLGIGMGTTVVTFAWSDMMTDMIQPFWAIAMLAVAKLHFRDIMG